VGDRLPSLLYGEREAEWVASGLTIKRRKPLVEKIRVEIRRVVEWVVDHCKLRHYTVIALDPPAAEESMSCLAAGGNENAL
jgi:glycosyl transferase, family 25